MNLVADIVQKKKEEAVQNAISNPLIPPRVVMSDLSTKVLNDPNTRQFGIPALPKTLSLAKEVSRKRLENLDATPIPKIWADMNVPEVFKKAMDGQDFVLLE